MHHDDLLTSNYCEWRFESPLCIETDPRISHGIVHFTTGAMENSNTDNLEIQACTFSDPTKTQ